MAGLAMLLLERSGAAVAALSGGTLTARLVPDRLPSVVQMLKREANALPWRRASIRSIRRRTGRG